MREIEMMIDVLKEARRLVELDERSLCTAIHRAANKGLYARQGWAVVDRNLSRWVMSMLEPSGSLVTWLQAEGIDVSYAYHRDRKATLDKLRVTRLAWIDWMIGELEKDLE